MDKKLDKTLTAPRLRARTIDLPPNLADRLQSARWPNRRNLNDEELGNLQLALMQGLGIKINRDLVTKVADYCCHVERLIDGRAAGNIEDLVLRFMVRLVASLTAPDGENGVCHMEIGALFGAATIFSCQASDIAGRGHRNVVIDPFAGYYDQIADPFTGVKVSEQVFRSNLAKFGFDDDRVQIFRGLSADAAIVRQTRGLRLLSLLIDGDHSYDGVKQDWINYACLVEPGGLVLIDDYNGRNWPEVTEFVNREVLAYLAGQWTPRLIFGSSILLQRNWNSATESVPDHLAHELCDVKRVVADLERQLADITSSRSWRITRPLRWLWRKYSQWKR